MIRLSVAGCGASSYLLRMRATAHGEGPRLKMTVHECPAVLAVYASQGCRCRRDGVEYQSITSLAAWGGAMGSRLAVVATSYLREGTAGPKHCAQLHSKFAPLILTGSANHKQLMYQ